MKIINSKNLFYGSVMILFMALTGCGSGFEDGDNTPPGDDTSPWQGTVLFGTAEHDRAYGITLDSSGNIFITGESEGNLDGKTNAGKSDIFLAKFKPSGEKEWVQLMGSDQDEQANAIAVDRNGNSYITGKSYGDIWDYTLAGDMGSDYDYLLVKCNSSGEKIWSHHLGSASGNYGNDIIVDADNIIHVSGSTWGGLDGDPGYGMWDAFLLKYDAGGGLNSTTFSGGSLRDCGNGMAMDSMGNIFLAGHGRSDMDGTSAGEHDLFLTKYNYSKSPVTVWVRQTGSFMDEYGYDAAVDNDDNIYVTGYTNSTMDGTTFIFLVKYSSSGEKLWTRIIGSGQNDVGRGVVVDSDNNVYVTGYTEGDLDGNINSGGNDVILMKYSSSGVNLWTKQLGTPYSDVAYGIAIDKKENSDDDIFITGRSAGNLDGKTNANEGVSFDIFIMKFNTSGEIQ